MWRSFRIPTTGSPILGVDSESEGSAEQSRGLAGTPLSLGSQEYRWRHRPRRALQGSRRFRSSERANSFRRSTPGSLAIRLTRRRRSSQNSLFCAVVGNGKSGTVLRALMRSARFIVESLALLGASAPPQIAPDADCNKEQADGADPSAARARSQRNGRALQGEGPQAQPLGSVQDIDACGANALDRSRGAH